MIAYKILVKNIVIEKYLFYKKQLVLSYKIQYPQFSSARFQKAAAVMNRYYKEKALTFQQYCTQKLYPMAVEEYENSMANNFPVRPFEALVTYKVTYNQDCAVSLYFDQYLYTGGAHGNTVRYSDTWNLQSARSINIDEMFKNSINYKAYIIMIINNQIAEQIKNGENIYFDDYKKNVVKYLNLNSFYLTPQGVVLYFQQYEIAPYSSGIPEFTIPYVEDYVIRPECK